MFKPHYFPYHIFISLARLGGCNNQYSQKFGQRRFTPVFSISINFFGAIYLSESVFFSTCNSATRLGVLIAACAFLFLIPFLLRLGTRST